MKHFLLSILIFIPFALFSQNTAIIDSLLNLLPTSQEDTNKIRIYEQLFNGRNGYFDK